MDRLYRFFKSVRLTVVMLLVIIALSVLATLIPQGREDTFYRQSYSAVVYRLVTVLHLGRFFSSLVFLLPVAVFALNLAVCAVDRFLRRARSKAPRRYGPDIIHIGLLLLIAGGMVTALAREEGDFTLGSGEQTTLTKAYSIKLLSLEFLRYEDGSPKAWIATVRVLHNGKEEIPSFPIRVNHPLRLPGVAIYQADWADKGTITLRDNDGREASGQPGQGFQEGESFWYFSEITASGDVQRAVFREYRGHDVVSTRALAPADRIGPYTVVSIQSRPVSGLKAVSDPGFLVIVAAVIVLMAGLALTYFQKKREQST